MKKVLILAALVLCIAPHFTLHGQALTVAEEKKGADGILEDFYGIVPQESGVLDGDTIDAVGFEAIFEAIALSLSGEGGRAFSFFAFTFGLAVICAAAGTADVGGAFGSSNASVEMAVSVVCSLGLFRRLYEVCITVRESLVSVADFFSALIPIMTGISVSAGEVTLASKQAVNMSITLAIVGKLAVSVLMPLSLALFALSVVGSLGGVGTSLAKGIKGIFTWGMGIISAVCTAAVAIQSLVASAADSAALRAARYAASGLIPVVGSTVSSALSTLVGGLTFVKSSVGALSVAVIVSLVVAPLVSLLLYRLALSVCIVFLDFTDNAGGIRCFSAFRSALDALTAVYTMSTLVCIVEVVIFMKSGVSV